MIDIKATTDEGEDLFDLFEIEDPELVRDLSVVWN